MPTQRERIRALLERNGQVSNYELLRLFMPRYAARILELKREWMAIGFMMTPTPTKKKLWIYYLIKK